MDLLQTSTGRKVLFASLYLSEGAPIGFIWWALPTKLRMEGYPVDEITKFTSILVLPWVLVSLVSACRYNPVATLDAAIVDSSNAIHDGFDPSSPLLL